MWYGKFWWAYSALRLVFPDVCYENDQIGCYDKEEPFDHFDILPNSPGPFGMDVQFKLYTRQNKKKPELLNNVLLKVDWVPSHFDKAIKTTILIHGFNDNGEMQWILKMKDSILEKENANVVIVDWGVGAKHMNYMIAASNTRTVGAYTGRLITAMVPDLSSVHVIGHSLGAQIAGFVGAWTEGKIGRITGLDPAGPLFDKYHPRARLDPSDAVFVDVIHTDTDGDFNLGLGMSNLCGDVDFFPNGGEVQPGCNQSALTIADNIVKLKVEELHRLFPCSHERSIRLYTESILSDCKFLFCPCTKEDFLKNVCPDYNCTQMGYDVDMNIRGTYFGYTRAQSPYCIKDTPTTLSSTEPDVFNATNPMSEEGGYQGAQFNITVDVSIEHNSTVVPLNTSHGSN